MAHHGARRLRLDRGRAGRLPSSPGAERLFCPHCGTPLVFRELAAQDSLDVTLASLDDPAGIGPGDHIWTSSRIAWFEVADDLPRHPERGPGNSG